MNLTKQEIRQGKELVRKHLAVDPSGTFCEVLLNLIYQDDPYLKKILERDELMRK